MTSATTGERERAVQRGWSVKDKGFVWERPPRKSDLAAAFLTAREH